MLCCPNAKAIFFVSLQYGLHLQIRAGSVLDLVGGFFDGGCFWFLKKGKMEWAGQICCVFCSAEMQPFILEEADLSVSPCVGCCTGVSWSLLEHLC